MRRSAALIFERSRSGRRAIDLPISDVPVESVSSLIPAAFLRKEPADLPEVSQLDLVRHFTELSQRTFGVDSGFYPLGSCTMKYNPKINEDVAALPGLAGLHPLEDVRDTQGALKLMFD
ncbi:MAG: gcvPB, partial [Firmicutes bacterium]|nr:gcvPB [Bacillota bacterium]